MAKMEYFLTQPGPRIPDIAIGRAQGNIEERRDLLQAQPNEVPLLDHLGLARVVGRQALERFMQEQQIARIHFRGGDIKAGVIYTHLLQPATVANRLAATSALNQDASHRLSRGGEKLGAVLPLGLRGTSEPEPGLMNESGGLKRVSRALVGHLGRGEFAQLAVNERKDFIRGASIPSISALQQRD